MPISFISTHMELLIHMELSVEMGEGYNFEPKKGRNNSIRNLDKSMAMLKAVSIRLRNNIKSKMK